MKLPAFLVYPALLSVLALTACASPEHSASARPVLYPNAKMQSMGQAQADAAINHCMAMAQQQGLQAGNNKVGQEAGRGAATAGVMAAVGALVTGGNGDSVLRSGARGAAVGAAGGAVHGAYENQGNPIYRRFVETCLSERGLSVMGWQ